MSDLPAIPPRSPDALLDDLLRAYVSTGGQLTAADLGSVNRLRKAAEMTTPDPRAAEWREIAASSRLRAEEATYRKRRLLQLVPSSSGVVDRSAELAAAELAARSLRRVDGAALWGHELSPPDDPPVSSTREMPHDHVAVHADALLRMQIEHEDALAALHKSRATLAAMMADHGDAGATLKHRHALDRAREGIANVAAGRTWSGQ